MAKRPEDMSFFELADSLDRQEEEENVNSKGVGKVSNKLAKQMDENSKKVAEMMAELDNEIVYQGFTKKELMKAFDLVVDAEHWKNPIDAVIDANKREVVDTAITFFAGSVAHFSHIDEDNLRVQARGYYSDIGS